jgi:hypothetical protein
MLDPENSFCDKTYPIGPPMMIYGQLADEDISLLSSSDVPNEAPGYQFPIFINLETCGRKILGMIGISDFKLPLNLWGTMHNSTHSSDENFRRKTRDENSSIDVNSWRLECLTDFKKSKMNLTQEGIKDEEETIKRLVINDSFSRHYGSCDDSISMTLLEIRELSILKNCTIDESLKSENNLMALKAKSHQSNISEKTLHSVFIDSYTYFKELYAGCQAILRTRKCCLILLWIGIVITSLVVVLTLSEKQKGKPRVNSRLHNSMPCQNKTNMISDCTCQDRLQSPLSKDMINRHTIVTWFLAQTGACYFLDPVAAGSGKKWALN